PAKKNPPAKLRRRGQGDVRSGAKTLSGGKIRRSRDGIRRDPAQISRSRTVYDSAGEKPLPARPVPRRLQRFHQSESPVSRSRNLLRIRLVLLQSEKL